MLLLEGPDMVGKTTLAEKIRKALYDMKAPAAAMKFGMESKGIMSVEYLARRINPWTVCDRMHPSEVIYAMARGDKPRLSPEDVQRLDVMMIDKRGMTVVLYADDDAYNKLIDLHHKRGEDYSAETCRVVNKMYATMAGTGMVATRYQFDVAMALKIELREGGRRIDYVTDEQAQTIAIEYARRQQKG